LRSAWAIPRDPVSKNKNKTKNKIKKQNKPPQTRRMCKQTGAYLCNETVFSSNKEYTTVIQNNMNKSQKQKYLVE
jgi:predicted phosphoadenosine phosphosulfate sulfurtransferase